MAIRERVYGALLPHHFGRYKLRRNYFVRVGFQILVSAVSEL